jgi:hypothetical protein
MDGIPVGGFFDGAAALRFGDAGFRVAGAVFFEGEGTGTFMPGMPGM